MKKLLLIMLITICSLSAKSQTYPSVITVNVEIPGTLQSFFPNSTSPNYYQTKAVTDLTVTGFINALDIKFINSNLYFDKLAKVDLSACTIVGYSGTVPNFGTTIKTFGDNVYPAIFTLTTIPLYLETYLIPISTTEIESYAFDFQYTPKYTGKTAIIKEFTIPENVKKIGIKIFTYENLGGNVGDTCVLTTLTTKILDPRLCTTHIWAFEGVNKISCTLHVPYGTSALYRATAPWNQFQTIVEDGVPTLIDFTGNVATAGTLYTLLPISELRRNIKSITITGFYNEDDIAFVQNVFPETVIFNTSGATLLSKMPLTVDVEEAGTISTLFTSAQLTSTTKLTITGYFTQDDVDYVKTHLPNLVSLLCDDMWGAGGYSYHICNAVVGNLQAIVTGDKYIPAAITNLYVSGKINQADLDYIEANFTNLTILDTSKATFFGIPTDITTHEENKISIYPNPCTNGFTIREAISEIGNYQLINSSGVTVKNVVGGEYVDVSDLAKGIYFVRGVGENEAVCFKVVKR